MLRPFITGAVAYLAVQIAWLVIGPLLGVPRLWVLGSSSGGVSCLVVVAIGGVFAGSIRPKHVPWAAHAALFWAGLMTVITLSLIWMNNNLLPFACAISGVVLAPAVLLGEGLGEILRRRRLRDVVPGPRCPHCGYPRQRGEGDRCPECGRLENEEEDASIDESARLKRLQGTSWKI